jgi:hypothetical protein
MAVSSLFTYRRIESMSQNLHDRLGDSQVTDVQPLQSQADISLDKDRLEASGRQVAILEDRIRVLLVRCSATEARLLLRSEDCDRISAIEAKNSLA